VRLEDLHIWECMFISGDAAHGVVLCISSRSGSGGSSSTKQQHPVQVHLVPEVPTCGLYIKFTNV
jgi:hypothetical protein